MTTRFFKPYLLGARHQIIVRSDHNNLKYFKSPKKVTPRQARWMNHLADYNFIIHHLPGKQNTIADLLSQRKDLERGMNNDYTTVLPDNLFLRTTYLPNDNQKRQQALRNIHDTPTGGHPGISNTFDLVKRKYHGPKLREFVENYVKECAKCQESKTIRTPHAPLHHFDTPVEEGPFQYVSIDFITDLPKSNGYNTILTTFAATAPSKPSTRKDSKQGVVSWWTIGTLMLTNTITIYVLISHSLAGVTPTSFSLHYNPSITLLPLQFIVPSFWIITSLLLLICRQVFGPTATETRSSCRYSTYFRTS